MAVVVWLGSKTLLWILRVWLTQPPSQVAVRKWCLRVCAWVVSQSDNDRPLSMGRMLPVYPVLHGVADVLGQIGLGTYADVGSKTLEWDEQLAVTKGQCEAPLDRMFATMEHITDGGLGAYPDPSPPKPGYDSDESLGEYSDGSYSDYPCGEDG